MAIFLAILALCVISFLPYLNAYTGGSPWSIVAESPLTFRGLSKQFILATGDPSLGILHLVGRSHFWFCSPQQLCAYIIFAEDAIRNGKSCYI